MTPTLQPLVVRFVSEKIKANYKRKEAKSHSWLSDYFVVVAIESYSESGNGYVVLVNDAGEVWWINNKHLRVLNLEDFCFSKADLA